MAAYEKSKSVKLKSISTMTEGTIWRQILLFSIPLILGNLLQQMYNTVDSIIVGNFVGSNALAAVGSSTSLICLLIAFSMGASAGAGVIVSQFYGAGDENGVQRSAHTALMLVVELKWNKNVKTALQQIKEKQYPDSVLDYTGDILLVGINYDKKTKEHQCLIEKYEKL